MYRQPNGHKEYADYQIDPHDKPPATCKVQIPASPDSNINKFIIFYQCKFGDGSSFCQFLVSFFFTIIKNKMRYCANPGIVRFLEDDPIQNTIDEHEKDIV